MIAKVQQEVALASIDNVRLCCGHLQVPWKQVVIANVALRGLWDYLRMGVLEPSIRAAVILLGYFVLSTERTCRNSFPQLWPSQADIQYSLFSRLRMNFDAPAARMVASLAVDYVYAVLGLCPADDPIARNTVPNYTLTAETLFMELALRLYQHYGSTVLPFCGNRSFSGSHLPTWVPDWSDMSPRLSLADAAGSYIYNACGNCSSFEHSAVGSELHLRATRVGSLSQQFKREAFRRCAAAVASGENVEARQIMDSSIITWLRLYSDFLKWIPSGSVASLDDASWRIPTADVDIKIEESMMEYCRAAPGMAELHAERSFKMLQALVDQMEDDAFLDMVRTRISQASKEQVLDENVQVDLATDGANKGLHVFQMTKQCTQLSDRIAEEDEHGGREIESDAAVYGSLLGRTIANRIPFLVDDVFIGLGPIAMEAGDHLYIIHGHSTPLVLRPTENNKHRIVGDAYVYGIMDGEFMATQPGSETLVII